MSQQTPRIALLGCSDGGKTTIFKTCRSMYGGVQYNNFHLSQENRKLIRKALRFEIIHHVRKAIDLMENYEDHKNLQQTTIQKKKERRNSQLDIPQSDSYPSPITSPVSPVGTQVPLSDDLGGVSGLMMDHSKLIQNASKQNSKESTGFLGRLTRFGRRRSTSDEPTTGNHGTTSAFSNALKIGEMASEAKVQKPNRSTGDMSEELHNDFDNIVEIEMPTYLEYQWNKSEEKAAHRIKDISVKTMNDRSWQSDYDGGLKALKADIKTLWKNNSFRQIFYNSDTYGFQSSGHIVYFMKNINRIFSDDFKPTEEDYLKMRTITTGVYSVDIKVNKSSIMKIYDTGGERCERKKWNRVLDLNPEVIIFVVSLSDFNQTCTEDNNQNRMQESLSSLTKLCQEVSRRQLKGLEIVLVFNKTDVFREKLEDKKSIAVCFPGFSALSTSSSYSDSIDSSSQKSVEESLKYIAKIFTDVVKKITSQPIVRLYEISSLDKKDIKYLMEDGIEPIIRRHEPNPPMIKDHTFRIMLGECDNSSNFDMMKQAGKKSSSVSSKTPQTNKRPALPKPNLFNSVSEAAELGPPKPYRPVSHPKLTPEEQELINKRIESEDAKETDYSEKYSIKKRIGQGGQATTYIVAEKDSSTDKKFFVMKRIKLRTIQELNENFNEIKSLYNLRHEFINSIYDFFVEQKESTVIADNIEADSENNGKQEYVLCIILEFCKGGDLRMFLDRFKKKGPTALVSQSQIVKWLKKLTTALVFIHSKGYLHRDLKPENIFFNDVDREELRLGDFGLSCIVNDKVARRVGTECYMSPEQDKGLEYSAASDIWSLGVIVLEIMMQRKVDVKGELSKNENYVSNVCSDLREIYSEELLDFVEMTLKLDPASRPSTPEQLLAIVDNIE